MNVYKYYGDAIYDKALGATKILPKVVGAIASKHQIPVGYLWDMFIKGALINQAKTPQAKAMAKIVHRLYLASFQPAQNFPVLELPNSAAAQKALQELNQWTNNKFYNILRKIITSEAKKASAAVVSLEGDLDSEAAYYYFLMILAEQLETPTVAYPNSLVRFMMLDTVVPDLIY